MTGFHRSGQYDVIPKGPVEDFLARTEGMTSLDEGRLLYELAREVVDGCIVEIGAYRGRSTVALGRGSLDGHRAPVFVVEPHLQFTGILGGQFGPADAGAFYRAVLESGCYHVVRLLSVTSAEITPNWHRPVGMLWIDGDHTYEGVKTDIDCWTPHLLSGATVVFDDAIDPSLGPHRLIQELLSGDRFEQVRNVGKIAVLRAR